MDVRGYDPVSATAGANPIGFATARGSIQGCKPSPSLKPATNSTLFQRIDMDMNFNFGIIDGELGIAEAGRQLFDPMPAAASGRRSMSEAHGTDDDAFLPWQIGAAR